MDLNELRVKITSVDERLLSLLAERRELAQGVIKNKQKTGKALRDAQREEDLLARLIAHGRELGLDAHFITRVFHEIIDDSVRSQQLFLLKGINDQKLPETVAYQGIEGAYSHLASQKFFEAISDQVNYVGYTKFSQVVEAVEEGEADFALLPVENTTAGNINDVYDLLSRTRLSIVGEEIFRVVHCLLGVDDAPIARVRRVLSHPQALAQCAHYLSQLKDCTADYFADTAMAVRKVKEDGDPTQAAIASEEAGRLYGLNVIARDLADQKENFTRFVVVAKNSIRLDSRIPSKTSMIIATAHQPGALSRALDVLSEHGINMTKLDARPKPGSPFDYLFYIDIEGHQEQKSVKDALAGLRAVTSYLKILGSYPRSERGKTQPRVEALLQPTTSSGEPPTEESSTSDSAPIPKSGASPLHSRSTRQDDTVLRIKDVEIGGDSFVVVAGPMYVESEEQVRQCARQVKESGGKLLLGSCFKPGDDPNSREALDYNSLQYLSAAGREYDLPVVTEVALPGDVRRVADSAQVLMIGARNMQNFALLDAVGHVSRAVILKRGMMATLEEFLGAAEYILERGNHQVILCERGIRTFETVSRHTLDLGAIPILKRMTHLPIIVDPSHAAGQQDLVAPMARAAKAVGPSGLMIDIHPKPGEAGVDEPQALDFAGFASLMRDIYGT